MVDFAAAGSYEVSLSAAQRANFGASNEAFQVKVDGTVVGTITPSGTSYATYTTAPFNVTAGSHTISFVGVDPSGADYTALIDQVRIDNVVSWAARIWGRHNARHEMFRGWLAKRS